MPLIMDDQDQYMDGLNDMNDMDDLFMEPPDALPAPVQLRAKDPSQRLDELQSSGCCQKLVWSRFGGIASIEPDGKTVQAHSYCYDASKQQYIISESNALQFAQGAVSQPLVHVEWNGSGLDLAVVDASGTISLFTTIVTLNRLMRVESITTDQNDVFGSVVGLEWLPMNRMIGYYHTTICKEGVWEYKAINPELKGPRHPIQAKSALAAVTRRGSLYLVYASAAKGYSNIHTDLGVHDSADCLLTHASITAEQDSSLLVATYDSCQTLRLYRVRIDWHYPFTAKQPPPKDFQLVPTMEVQRLLVHPCCKMETADFEAPLASQLYHLKIVPATGDPSTKQTSAATIVTIFSVPESQNTMQAQSGNVTSHVVRWELSKTQSKLHQCFDSLGQKKSKASSSSFSPTHSLKRLDEFTIPSVVINLHSIRLDTIIVLARADGIVEFRDRFSMAPINAALQTESISNMLQTGFAYPSLGPLTSISFSSNSCIAVSRQQDGELKIHYMSLFSDSIEMLDSGVRKSAIIAGLSLIFASSLAASISSDDVLALMHKSMDVASAGDFIDGIFTSIGVHVDFSQGESEHEKLIRNPYIPRCISAQQQLGHGSQVSISAKVAKTILNLRYTATALHMSYQTITNTVDPDLPYTILGVIKWYLSLMAFITDGMLKLSHECHGKEDDRAFIQEKVDAHNSPAFLIVLCSISRVLLKYGCRCLRSIMNNARALSNTGSASAKGWTAFVATVAAAPLDLFQFESTLAEIDHHIVAAYSSTSTPISQDARRAAEKQLLFHGQIPEVLMPAVQRLLTTTSAKVYENDHVDPAAIYFADFRILDLTDDKRTKDFNKKARIDILRKIPLTGHTKVRRCTRCNAYLEDLLPGPQVRPGAGGYVMSIQKSCICGNPWVLVDA